MPTINFDNLGDVIDYTFDTSIIESINGDDDTCVLSNGRTALIFYHCTENEVLRSNGAIRGSAGGFSVNDEVIILYKDSITYVVGHTDGVRHCEYYLRCRFNGNLPINGGEWVLIRNSDQVYPLVNLGVEGMAKWVNGGTGLCGPFRQQFGTNTYAYVNTRHNSGYDLCNLYREGDEDNWDYLVWTFNNYRTIINRYDMSSHQLPTFAFGMTPKAGFNPSTFPYDIQLYLNRVQRVRNTVLLKDINPSTDIIDGKSVIVYDVNFELLTSHRTYDNGVSNSYPFSTFPAIETWAYKFNFEITEEYAYRHGGGMAVKGSPSSADIQFSGGSGYMETACQYEYPEGSGTINDFGSVIGLEAFWQMNTSGIDLSMVYIPGTENGPDNIPGEFMIGQGLFVCNMYHRCYSKPTGSQHEFSSGLNVSYSNLKTTTFSFKPSPATSF